MRSYLRATVLAAALGAALPAATHEYKEGTIKIEHPRAVATPAGAKTASAYMKIVNTGKEPLVIKSLSTPAAEKAEVHTMTMTDGIMRMRPVEFPLTIAPGATLDITRDRHIMLIGLKKPLAEEDMVDFKIEFADGKTMTFDLYVEARAHAEDHDGH
jgi:hypothetical protein